MTEIMTAPTGVEPDGEASSRKTLVIAGSVGGALLLAGAGWFLLKGGGSDTAALPPVVHHAPKTAPAHTAAGKAAAPATPRGSTVPIMKLPATSTTQLGRDPFAALYLLPAAATGSSAPAPGSSTPATGTPGTTGTTGSTAGGTTAPAAPTTYPLKLGKVYGAGADRTAVFSVAGKTQVARVGSVFGRSAELKLLSFQQVRPGVWTVTLQVGDADPTDIATNETILVM